MLSVTASSASRRPQARRVKTSPALRAEYRPDSSKTDRQHAITAAHIAYERGKSRTRERPAPLSDRHRDQSEEGEHIQQRQSIRFAGPNAELDCTRSITRRDVPGPDLNIRDDNCRQAIEPRSQISALPDEFNEDHIASVPSSYRRLRKAKSMFSPGRSMPVVSPVIPRAGRHFQRHSQQSSVGSNEPIRVSDLRLRRSFSFLSGVSERISTGSDRQYRAQDAAIQMARDSYLRQLEQQRLKEQPSFLNLHRLRAPQKVFKRTVRSSSTNSYGSAIASPTPLNAFGEPTKIQVIGLRARSFSQTWKAKIWRVLKGSRHETTTLPAQQLSATHAHYGEASMESDYWTESHPTTSEPNAELLRRAESRESLEDPVGFPAERFARNGSSIRSVQSDENHEQNASRVTSWTNSTNTATFVMPQVMERKRLSVIKEDGGPHHPSSSARYCTSLDDGYANFRQPLGQVNLSREETQRLASAVQRKHETYGRGTDSEKEALGEENVEQQPVSRSLGTPRRSFSNKQRSPCPISVDSSRPAMKTSKSWGAGDMPFENLRESQNHEYQQGQFSYRRKLTPQEIAETNESRELPSKRPLRVVKSAFFPPSRHNETSNTPSPFRRVLQSREEETLEIQEGQRPSSEITRANLLNSTIARPRIGSVSGSESIYSRSTGGHVSQAAGSSSSIASFRSTEEAGTAIIINGGPLRHVPARYSSANSSGDWKKFMASQVANLEKQASATDGIFNALPIKDSGHKRECAQINDDDVTVGDLQAPDRKSKQPIGEILNNTEACSAMHPVLPASSMVQSQFTAYTMPDSGRGFFSKSQSDGLPAKPRTKSLNKENENGDPRHYSYPAARSPKESPQSTLLSTTTPQQTSKQNKPWPSPRESPERVERLRRLKNSSVTSLRKPLTPRENLATPPVSTPTSPWPTIEDSPITPRSEGMKNRQMLDEFLKERRSQMLSSDDTGNDPAFV
ncbi:hypothetical protein MMC21_004467 [Puttea exsequens]|nr:hypothetical protein [Puttea exsequens]